MDAVAPASSRLFGLGQLDLLKSVRRQDGDFFPDSSPDMGSLLILRRVNPRSRGGGGERAKAVPLGY